MPLPPKCCGLRCTLTSSSPLTFIPRVLCHQNSCHLCCLGGKQALSDELCLGAHSESRIGIWAFLFQFILSYDLGTPVPPKLHSSYLEFLCPPFQGTCPARQQTTSFSPTQRKANAGALVPASLSLPSQVCATMQRRRRLAITTQLQSTGRSTWWHLRTGVLSQVKGSVEES